MFKVRDLISEAKALGSFIVETVKLAFEPPYKVDDAIKALEDRINKSPFKDILKVVYLPEATWFNAEIDLVYISSYIRYMNKIKAYPDIYDDILEMVDDIHLLIKEDNGLKYASRGKTWTM